jgi:hypothetical protein
MILKYKTGKLPPNFTALGVILFIVSVWRIIVLDWKGILFFLISLLFLFIKSGIIIDTDNKSLKKYIGFFVIKKGEWEDISNLSNLQIIKTKASQSMNVLSINRVETIVLYKLIMILPNKKIELLAGKKDYIIKISKEISHSLQTEVL